jgi:hypothetical protein
MTGTLNPCALWSTHLKNMSLGNDFTKHVFEEWVSQLNISCKMGSKLLLRICWIKLAGKGTLAPWYETIGIILIA